MKTFIVAAVVALTVSAGTATGSSWISGRRIKPHSIPANRLTRPPALIPADTTSFTHVDKSVSVPAKGFGSVLAACPTGELVVGGGFNLNSTAVLVSGSFPASDWTGWVVSYQNFGAQAETVHVYGVCT